MEQQNKKYKMSTSNLKCSISVLEGVCLFSSIATLDVNWVSSCVWGIADNYYLSMKYLMKILGKVLNLSVAPECQFYSVDLSN